MEEKTLLPRYWEKRVLAAYLLMMGDTWEATCRKIGRSKMTLSYWKRDIVWWEKAKAEAEKRWLYDVKDAARRAVYSQLTVERDGDLGLKVLERLDPDFAPKQKVEHTGEDGKDLVIRVVYGDGSPPGAKT
jgi:hypothetical protein